VLIDGRNRREACRRAGVIPDYVLLDDHDPVTYILSANINRRHMTKGQRAMVVAKICFETKQSVRDGAKQSGLTAGRLGYAMAVINHAPDLAEQVINGSFSGSGEQWNREPTLALGIDSLKKIEKVHSTH
jgi:hypothetical protein